MTCARNSTRVRTESPHGQTTGRISPETQESPRPSHEGQGRGEVVSDGLVGTLTGTGVGACMPSPNPGPAVVRPLAGLAESRRAVAPEARHRPRGSGALGDQVYPFVGSVGLD